MIAQAKVDPSLKDKASVALRTALKILEKWQATTEQTLSILRISRSTANRAKQGNSIELDGDQLQRASLILNCHSSLRLIFENPDNVYGFVRMDNHNPFFNGRKPLDVMAQGDFISLYETFRRIDSLRGANW